MKFLLYISDNAIGNRYVEIINRIALLDVFEKLRYVNGKKEE